MRTVIIFLLTYLVIFGFVWSTAVCDGGLCPLELSWQQLPKTWKSTIWVMHLSHVSQASCNRHHGTGNHVLHPLTRLKRRVFPESHSPTSSTALLTVLLVRKYFRKTEERKREGWLLVYRQRLKNISCLFKDWFTVCQVCLKSTLK